MFRRSLPFIFCVLTIATTALPALAKKNNPVVKLDYVPQQNVREVEARVDRAQRTTPVALRFIDDRRLADPAELGIRTDDGDRRHELTAAGDVMRFVEDTVTGILKDWGVALDPGAPRVLELTLDEFRVHESNQAVGATFEGEVSLDGRLLEGERVLWSGRASGGATRYGRKFSNTNVNEVLSDGLLEAVSQVVSARSLQLAWSAKPDAAPRRTADAGSQREAVSPEKLLQELQTFKDGGFELATMVEYLKRKALTRPLNAEDLAALKNAGVPEDVIRSVVNLPTS